MPNEIRKIEFSNPELQAALVSYCLRHNIHFPDAFINRINVEWQGETTATIVFADREPDSDSRTVVLQRAEIAAALIDYVHANHMPLPHYGEKVMEPFGDGIALLVHYAWGEIGT